MVFEAARTQAGQLAGPVFLLSFGQRDELAAQVGKAGWQVVAARRSEGLARRLARSGAEMVVVDAREGAAEALKAAKALAQAHLPTVLIYRAAQREILSDFLALGVTHLLRAPFVGRELEATLMLAAHCLQRVPHIAVSAGNRDMLTGLSQILELREWIVREMASGPVSLLLVNISRFDAINASFGREVGDAALRALAHRVEPLVAELVDVRTIFARMPGAEFAIGLSGELTPERLLLLAELIVEAISRPFGTEEGQVRLGCRIAGVEARGKRKSAAALIREAGSALGEIRDGDVAPIRLMLGKDADFAAVTKSLHADLRSALANDEIDVLFQPQVGVANGRIEGVEALARWQHPVRGELGAATLFAVADQSNYLAELSAHIQRKALFAAAAWPEALSHIRLAVNVTAPDIARPRFARTFQSLIEESGFPHQRLTIEVTESGLMENLDAAAKTLADFRTLGCRVAIDDFGTGYSSLAWLKTLPADYLKLDKGLAGEILGGARDSVVLRGVISMARSLGLSVIAEGVETEGQLALLAREGCGLYQGFLCSPALDATALVTLVVSQDQA